MKHLRFPVKPGHFPMKHGRFLLTRYNLADHALYLIQTAAAERTGDRSWFQMAPTLPDDTAPWPTPA